MEVWILGAIYIIIFYIVISLVYYVKKNKSSYGIDKVINSNNCVEDINNERLLKEYEQLIVRFKDEFDITKSDLTYSISMFNKKMKSEVSKIINSIWFEELELLNNDNSLVEKIKKMYKVNASDWKKKIGEI